MANEKLTDKKTLSVIVLVAVAILIGTIIHIDIIYGPRPKHPSTIHFQPTIHRKRYCFMDSKPINNNGNHTAFRGIRLEDEKKAEDKQ